MSRPDTLWIVTKAVGVWGADAESMQAVWEFQGIYASEAEAIRRCEGPHWGIAPVRVGEHVPTERHEWVGFAYPLAKQVSA